MTLEKMEISTSSHASSPSLSSSQSFLGYCWRLGRHDTGEDWEWIEYLGLSPESLVSWRLLAVYAPPRNSLSEQTKWIARMIEGIALSAIVVLVISIAALGPLFLS